MTQGSTAGRGDVIVLVGTRKGAFILTSSRDRKDWSLSGPHCAGGDVFHMAYDPRNGSAYVAVNDPVWGPEIRVTRDLGRTWAERGQSPKFADARDMSINKLWHVEPGRPEEPGVLYAGVDPASLFKSEDDGATWREVEGLTSHPSRGSWQPGLGGLCLHSMVLHPTNIETMWVGISAVGVFRTDDGGESWRPLNKGVRADFLPDPLPELGQCPHKLLSPSSQRDTLYQQNHCGVYRSDNGGQSWEDITEGLPSRFGFVLGLHSQDPDTLYVMPEDNVQGTDVGGGYRIVSDAKMRVYRSRNRGNDWEPLTKGLPQENAYIHSMREGMTTDSLDPCGIYVGTTTGQIFHSHDDGDSWEMIFDQLPPINSVDCAIVV